MSTIRHPPFAPLFPYTTLFRSLGGPGAGPAQLRRSDDPAWHQQAGRQDTALTADPRGALGGAPRDRKSTRLNSSHVAISYAVFCLKKKKTSGAAYRTKLAEGQD